MADTPLVELEVEDAVATLTIARPDKLNALNADTLGALARVFATAVEDPAAKGIIVTGSGDRAFVAGADIGELSRMTPLDAVEVSRRGQAVFAAIERSPKPVVAAVSGFALGGGCELALACHLRVASRKARFGFPEVKLGILPGYGGTVRLPRVIGRGAALEMILTGGMVDAEEAYRIGLVNRVEEPERVMDAARELLGRILANAPIAVRCATEAVVRGADTSTEEALALESQFFGLLAATEDMREGMSAFLEKREPEFRNR